MSNLKSPQKWYKIVYSKGPGSPHLEDNVQAASAQEAVSSLRFDVNGHIVVLYVWESVDPFQFQDTSNWERNVQFMRIECPQLTDEHQDKVAGELAKEIEELVNKKMNQFLVKPRKFVVSLGGFYRGDHNWDNIDAPGSCVNGPNRGSGDNEP